MHAAVLGSPISHSLSPILHRAAYAELGLQYDYRAIDITTETFTQFMDTIDSSWIGLSLTMPLKEVAFEVANEVSAVAVLAHAINTLIIGDVIQGDNTDVLGIVNAVREMTSHDLNRAVIFGSGATARSSIIAASQLGVTDIQAVARNHTALAECRTIANKLGVTFQDVPIADVTFDHNTLTINTTPGGVADAIADAVIDPLGPVLDVVYHPWPSALAKRWQLAECIAIPGYLMLLHQAAKQVELMTGQEAPLHAMRSALMAALNNR
jgi:shikimate dehydrogenase